MADITCVLCGERYPEMVGYEGTEQALGCASELRDDLVIGYFGSRVLDTMMARFVDGRPAQAADGPVCDDCITAHIEAGSLEIGLHIADTASGIDPAEAILEGLAFEAVTGGEKAATGGYQD